MISWTRRCMSVSSECMGLTPLPRIHLNFLNLILVKGTLTSLNLVGGGGGTVKGPRRFVPFLKCLKITNMLSSRFRKIHQLRVLFSFKKFLFVVEVCGVWYCSDLGCCWKIIYNPWCIELCFYFRQKGSILGSPK